MLPSLRSRPRPGIGLLVFVSTYSQDNEALGTELSQALKSCETVTGRESQRLATKLSTGGRKWFPSPEFQCLTPPQSSPTLKTVQAGPRVSNGFSAHSPSNVGIVSALQSVRWGLRHKEPSSGGLLQAS